MTRLIAPDEFDALSRPFVEFAFRLETLQVYAASGEDEWIAAFERGDAAPPPDPEQDAWEGAIRGHRAAGRSVQRVHVVEEPLTSYMRFELSWAYPPNVRAGEDVRILPVERGQWSGEVPDFWLFDDRELLIAHYADNGSWLGVEPIDDPGRVDQARRWRKTALDRAVAWAEYMASRPDLAARVPAA